MDSPSHLAFVFCVSAGQNGENLGFDEEPIVAIVLSLYDISKNRVQETQRYFVKPERGEDCPDVSDLSEECKIQTGIEEQDVRTASNLSTVLEQIEGFFSCQDVLPFTSGSGTQRSFCLCTDGQLHLRTCLLPEAARRGIQLPVHYRKFIDLRKEFKRFYKPLKPTHGLRDLLDFLHLRSLDALEYGVRQCQEMASVVQRLVANGHKFQHYESIRDSVEPYSGIADVIDDDTIVRARGLPWQASDIDVASFFTGLNIARGGVLLCLSEKGRRNGEAVVRFESKEQRDLALRRHRHHLGHRYVEVYRATALDFRETAGAKENFTMSRDFLQRRTDCGDQAIVRMRGLPYSCTAQQVLEFFRTGSPSAEVLDGENGVLFIHQWDGRVTGDAFAMFGSEEEATRALSKHKLRIGSRYIELFKSNNAEVQQVLKRSLDSRNSCSELLEDNKQRQQQQPVLPPCQVVHPLPPHSSASGAQPLHHAFPPASPRSCIRLRGLPYDVTVAEILVFLGEFSKNVSLHGVHLIYDSLGRSVGEALVQMNSESWAEVATAQRNGRPYSSRKSHYMVEVQQCSMDEMSLDLVSPSLALPGVALAGGSPGAVVPVLLSHSRQLPQLVSMTHPQTVGPGSGHLFPAYNVGSPLLSPPTPTNVFAGSNLAYPTTALSLTAELPRASLPIQTNNPFTLTQIPLVHTFLKPMAVATSYQPVLYCFPGTTVPLQNAYQKLPCNVAMKGLPMSVQSVDILQFLHGLYQVTPEIQLTRGPDGCPSGEALVTFSSRLEAERVVKELNFKMFGDCIVELFLV